MEPAAAVTILAAVVIVAALVVYLVSTIVQLRKIHEGLAVVIPAVGEIVAKTAPVNGVLSAINGTLLAGAQLLEGLLLKKGGPDAGSGLLESVFPGEGRNWLRLVGKSGTPAAIGDVFEPGVATLNALVAAVSPKPAAYASAASDSPS